MAPCASCYNRLATASHEIAHSPKLKAQVEKVLQTKIGKLPRVLNVIELLAQVAESIGPKVTKKFEQTVACYYGCLLVRPAKITGFDRTEDPVEMDKLVAAARPSTGTSRPSVAAPRSRCRARQWSAVWVPRSCGMRLAGRPRPSWSHARCAIRISICVAVRSIGTSTKPPTSRCSSSPRSSAWRSAFPARSSASAATSCR